MPLKLFVPSSAFRIIRSKHDVPAVKFDLSYGFAVFNNNHNTLKPLEVITNSATKYSTPVFLFPGFEGRMKFIKPLINNLSRTVYCLQYPFEKSLPTIPQYVDHLLPIMKKHLETTEAIKMIAHSFGGLVAMETIRRLELENRNISLCLLDSSPSAMKYMVAVSLGDADKRTDFDVDYIVHFARSMKMPHPEKYYHLVNPHDSWSTKLNTLLKDIPEQKSLTKSQIYTVINGLYNAMRAILYFDDAFPKLNCRTTLFRSTGKAMVPFPDDFEIEKHFSKPVTVNNAKGHHFNMVTYEETAESINAALET